MNPNSIQPIIIVLLTIGAFLSLTLGSSLIISKTSKAKANVLLSALLLSFLPTFITSLLYQFDHLQKFPHLIGLTSITQFLIGPLVYLYVRACIENRFQFFKTDILHFIPFFIDVILMSNFLSKSGNEKMYVFEIMMNNGPLIQSKIIILIKTLYNLIYIFMAFKIAVDYRKYLKNSNSNIDKVFYWWVFVFLVMVFFPILTQFAFGFFESKRALMFIDLTGSFVFFLVVYYANLLKPELFHEFPHLLLEDHSSIPEIKEKYENSSLHEDQKHIYVKKLLEFMETNKPYHQPDLTLSKLSDHINVPVHYLSQIINEKLDVNFLDFINSYRINEAKDKLIDPDFSHLSILGVAFDVGFNAKSTFYSVFKKQTGMTPTEFIREHKTSTQPNTSKINYTTLNGQHAFKT